MLPLTTTVLPETAGPPHGLIGKLLAPFDVARLRVEGEQGAIADLLLVEKRRRDEHEVTGHRDRSIDVPFLLALLPDEHRRRLRH